VNERLKLSYRLSHSFFCGGITFELRTNYSVMMYFSCTSLKIPEPMKNIFLILLFLSIHAIGQTAEGVGVSSNMPTRLKELVINSNQTVDIGYSKSKRKKIKSGLGIDKFAQMAVFIENPFKTAVVITSVSFNIVSVTGRPAYRLHLYRKQREKNIRGEDAPGDDIPTKNMVYFLEENIKGLVEIDLAEEGIEMPEEGVYVALEGLGSYDENGRADNNGFIPEMFQTFEPIYCYNYDSFKRSIGWVNNCQLIRRDEKAMNTSVSKKNFLAPSFGLTVFKR